MISTSLSPSSFPCHKNVTIRKIKIFKGKTWHFLPAITFLVFGSLFRKRDVGGILLNQESLLSISSNALFIAFILLLIAIVPLGLAVKSKRKIFGKLGLLFTYIAFALQLVYFVVRWVAVDHAPVSNMYEFMTFFGIMLTGSYLIIHFLYKQIVVGLFTIPVSLIILGYGSVFAKEVSPLVPSLQSHWLTIHVMTVAFSSAILSVSFATGLIYLLRTLDVSKIYQYIRA